MEGLDANRGFPFGNDLLFATCNFLTVFFTFARTFLLFFTFVENSVCCEASIDSYDDSVLLWNIFLIQKLVIFYFQALVFNAIF